MIRNQLFAAMDEIESSDHHQRNQLLLRNGRWGTCGDCPRVNGAAYPDRGTNTDRYDHHIEISARTAELLRSHQQGQFTNMKPTTLIQRLSRPHPALTPKQANAFSFGGGKRYGGLSEEAMNLFGPLFKFDYMGAAQYEYGAVPEALNKLADAAQSPSGLSLYPIGVDLCQINLPESLLKKGFIKEWVRVESLWIVCARADSEEIINRVRTLARYESSNRVECQAAGIYLRDALQLDRRLKMVRPDWDDVIGGLELDNGFLISLEQEMAVGFLKIFQGEPQNAT